MTGANPNSLVSAATDALLMNVAAHSDRLAARMTEQAVKDEISLQMPDWKMIQLSHTIGIAVDAQAIYQAERAQLASWIAAKNVEKILARYPVRDTGALGAIASALQFKTRAVYEAAVRKMSLNTQASKRIYFLILGSFRHNSTEQRPGIALILVQRTPRPFRPLSGHENTRF